MNLVWINYLKFTLVLFGECKVLNSNYFHAFNYVNTHARDVLLKMSLEEIDFKIIPDI